MNKLTHDEFLSLLKKYDFKKNSINSFSKKYNVCVTTIKKYITILQIPYNKKQRTVMHERNITGEFMSKVFETKKPVKNVKFVETNKTINKQELIIEKNNLLHQLETQKENETIANFHKRKQIIRIKLAELQEKLN